MTTEFNLCPVTVTALTHQAKCLFAYAAIAPLKDEGDIIQAATRLQAAAAFIPATNVHERQLKRDLLEFFRMLSVPEEHADEIAALEEELAHA